MSIDWNKIKNEFETTDISLVELADKYDIKYPTIKSRKQRQFWSKDASKKTKGASKNKNSGAPNGNKNAVGNIGGGAPPGNQNAIGNHGGAPNKNKNAETHGFFSRILPPDMLSIALEIMDKSPLDMIWENIIIKYTAIIRSQKIMYVQDHDDMTKELKKSKVEKTLEPGKKGEELQQFETYREEEFEIQFAWDKQATFLNAQSRAMSELRSLIKDFLTLSGEDDMRRLQLEKMQQDISIQKEKLEIEKEHLELAKKKASGEGDSEDELIDDWVDSVVEEEPHGE